MSEDKMMISISDEFYRVRKVCSDLGACNQLNNNNKNRTNYAQMEASRFDIEALLDEAKEMRSILVTK